MMLRRCALFLCLLAFSGPAFGDAPQFDPKPWLDDLTQMRTAFATKYANLEWAVFDRQADLNDYFARAQSHIEQAPDAGSARAAFDGLIRRLGDGHVQVDWPTPKSLPSQSQTPDACGDYDASYSVKPLAALAPGYVALNTPQSDVFPAGVIVSAKHRVGVLQIGMFSPQGSPALCKEALAALAIAEDKPCNESCSDRIDAWASARMTHLFMAQIEALKAAKVDTLMIDIAGNGGGSEWAEAAMRIVTPIRLQSERMDFVRGAQWIKEFGDLETKLRQAAQTAMPSDKAFLLRLADQAKSKRADAGTHCDSEPLWRGEHPACSLLGQGFYGSGLIASADPAMLSGKPWAATVFSPMEFPYREGVWRGPLMVLADNESWSAAEEFAAVLQDNHAAIIVGVPTGGAGCGHTDGSEPVVLAHSGGKLELPDCARLRADGSNEVRGVRPDVLVGWRKFDGPRLRAADLQAALPGALEKFRK